MAVMRSSRKTLLWVALAALLSQNLVIPVASFEDQKTYYTPDPHAHTPPAVSYYPPPHSSGGGHATPTPSHGGGSPPANCGTPPNHHHHTPSPPTGGGYYNPPTHTPSTPHTPIPPTTPVDPGTPSPPTGGGYYNPPTHTPSTPHTPTPPTTPVDPGTPTGGGYYNPPTHTPSTPPTTPVDPGTPSPPTGGGYYNPPTPTTPYTPTPPTTPIDPGTPNPPSITFPSPPFPISPPFTCTYWRNHPTLIFALFGWWGSVGTAFGVPSSTTGLGSNMNLLQALSNTRTDGFGELYREGTAALLNSMSHTRFPYTTNQVQNSFVAGLSSNKAATAQAQLFKLANEGRIKPRH
ncbi:hypothetical protein ACS0TY_018813 [Phlomoides rotata]